MSKQVEVDNESCFCGESRAQSGMCLQEPTQLLHSDVLFELGGVRRSSSYRFLLSLFVVMCVCESATKDEVIRVAERQI